MNRSSGSSRDVGPETTLVVIDGAYFMDGMTVKAAARNAVRVENLHQRSSQSHCISLFAGGFDCMSGNLNVGTESIFNLVWRYAKPHRALHRYVRSAYAINSECPFLVIVHLHMTYPTKYQ